MQGYYRRLKYTEMMWILFPAFQMVLFWNCVFFINKMQVQVFDVWEEGLLSIIKRIKGTLCKI